MLATEGGSVETICTHMATLRGLHKSAEHNRIQMRKQLEFRTAGYYKVRYLGAESWQICDVPPSHGAAEWLFVNQNEVPIVYWNSIKQGVTLIG